jgi:hypothetical protein
MNRNIRLFWFGVWANTLRAIGGGLLTIGFIGTFFKWYFSILIILGIGITLYGRSLRFDYQRRSGYIVHRGD